MRKVASSILARGTKIFVAPGEHGFSFFQVKLFTGSVSVLLTGTSLKIKNLKKKIIAGFRWFQVVPCFSNYRLFILLSLLIYSIRIPFPFPDSMFQGAFENGAKIFSFPSCRRGLTNG